MYRNLRCQWCGLEMSGEFAEKPAYHDECKKHSEQFQISKGNLEVDLRALAYLAGMLSRDEEKAFETAHEHLARLTKLFYSCLELRKTRKG